jgi:hypothetical protein
MSGVSRSHSPPAPASVRTASCEYRHPVPDLQSLQGAYVQNVERLEERAERMSMGSDIGEEIRKLQQEQKLSDSRRSSLLSSIADHPPRSRNVSTSSFSNSIVEVNSAARYGAYSPNGFMRSPIGSMRSGSWSHVSHSASMSRASRLGVLSISDSGDATVHSPTDDLTLHASTGHEQTPKVLSSESSHSNLAVSENMDGQQKRASRLPSDVSFTHLYNQLTETNGSASHLAAARIPSDTSFTDIYDQIAGEIRDHLDSPRGQTSGRNTSPQHTPVSELSRQLGAALSSPPADSAAQHSDDNPPPPPLHTSFHLVRNSNIPELAREEPKKAPALAPPIELDGITENKEFAAFDLDLHDRPPTAASTDTFAQAQTLFRDFDGAHYAPSIRQSIMEEVDEGDLKEGEERRSSLVRMLPQPETRLPPPGEGMVYYPAPVPRMLNLPKRLSQAPSAAVQARRRTQMLDALPSGIRKSVPWLGKDGDAMPDAGGDPRESRMNLASIPPQLRASLFFEHTGTGRPEVSVREGSAMATLEDLLDASAKAPVSAFTDHPFAGHAGGNVYKREAASRSSVSLQRALEKKDEKKDKPRSSFLGLRRSSLSSVNALEEGRKTPSKIQKGNSRGSSMNLDDAALARGPKGEIGGDGRNTPLRHSQLLDEHGEPLDEDSASIEDEEGEVEGGGEDEDEESYFGPPTTLLAELTLRKKEQKSRNRTAFTSFPNGMHSTLLELDAVAQLEKSKRKKTRVALAWEDPNLRAAEDAAEDDDDVPLGMLYKDQSSKVKSQLRDHGLADWDRPLGLIEKREMEDNEPLSRRRNRLLGIQPNRNTMASSTDLTAAGQNAATGASSEDEGETLAQRVRRLKDKKTLDDTIGTDERPVSAAFTTEILGQFGVQDPERKKSPFAPPKSDGKASPAPVLPDRTQSETPDEEETLGQRRARLQRENLQQQQPQQTWRSSQMSLDADNTVNRASQISLGVQQTLDPRASQMLLPQDQLQQSQSRRVSRSMADLLAAHPVGNNQPRKVSNELLVSLLPPDSLLAKHEERSNGRKAELQATNRRSSAMMIPGQKPFIDVPDARPSNNRRKSGGFKGGIYNNGAGVASQQQQQQIPMVDPNAHMYQAPMMGYGMPMGMMSSPNLMMPYGQPQMPMMAFGAMSNPNLMQGMNAFGAMSNPNLVAGGGYTYPYPRNSTFVAMPQQMGDPAIDNKTRERVDAWIQGVPS